ncbi:hypothetical protein [Streptomyces sp. NPDC087298]|uniref:hypothetical protein n=1 Tax=Streptomyces sp. NPDC087298 TaxID=3365779 RepID=UPI00382A0EE7
MTSSPAPVRSLDAAVDVFIANPRFEQGVTGWSFTPGAGLSGHNPHTGTTAAYIDSGAGKKVSQVVPAGRAGTYDVSAWIATGGEGAGFTVTVNSGTPVALRLPHQDRYARYTHSRVALRPGDRCEIAFESGDGWVNIDDVMLSPAAPADPVATSSSQEAVDMLDWAKRKANSWVHMPASVGPIDVDEHTPAGRGMATYAPSYWAGYAYRSGYYARDFAHQVVGAQILGLNAENRTMLGSFAASATAEHVYYPVWSYNFDTRTYLVIDYEGASKFVREVPAVFELVEKTNQAYRWSGDASYLNDPVVWNFCKNATGAFVARHDSQLRNGVAEGTGRGIFEGAASYNEQASEHLAEAGDAIASQYQAYLALAALARDKKDNTLATQCDQHARDLAAYFNTTWSGTGTGGAMRRAYSTSGTPIDGWGLENSWFMPMKQLIQPGPRNNAYLDFIEAQLAGPGRPRNIEALTYLPDTFFNNGRNETAWGGMQYIYAHRDEQHPSERQGPNGDYPEVSFALLAQLVAGLLGLEPDAPRHALTTHSRLPGAIEWLQITGIPIGNETFTVRHDGTHTSTLTNHASTAYTWEARFTGAHLTITVDGTPQTGKTKTVHETECTYTLVDVGPGATVTAHVRPAA